MIRFYYVGECRETSGCKASSISAPKDRQPRDLHSRNNSASPVLTSKTGVSIGALLGPLPSQLCQALLIFRGTF